MAWAHTAGVTGTFAEVCKSKEAIAHVLKELALQASKSKLKGFEVVKAVHLDHEEFSVEKDTLTPTFKVKRPQLQKQYQVVVDAMYKAIKSG